MMTILTWLKFQLEWTLVGRMLGVLFVVSQAVLVSGCSDDSVTNGDSSQPEIAEIAQALDMAWSFQFPRTDFVAGSYSGRDFLSPSNHLGEDSAHAHYARVHAVGNGVVKFSGAASGYGKAVAIEHQLPNNEYVVSIYGHLCSHAGYPTIANGALVTKGQLIGYVGSDAENGDGAEHIHLGIRKGAWDGKICGYSGTTGCTARNYYDPTTFINERSGGLRVISGVSVNAPSASGTLTFTAQVQNGYYYGGNFEFRISTGSTTSALVTQWLNPQDTRTLSFSQVINTSGSHSATLQFKAPNTATWWTVTPSSGASNPVSFTR